MFRLWEAFQDNLFPGSFNNKLLKKKKKRTREMKEGLKIKRDLRDTEPSQNVNSI